MKHSYEFLLSFIHTAILLTRRINIYNGLSVGRFLCNASTSSGFSAE